MNVRDLIELPVLRDAGVHVLAGREQLDREVRWAHAGEISDIARYLTGGEALLTAATGLIGTAEVDRRRYVRSLADVGVAIVLVELGRTFAVIPDDMLEESRAAGLVLAEIRREVPFIAVMRAVHTSIIDAHHGAFADAAEIGDEIDRVVLDGASTQELLDLLAERLKNPVILEDGSHRVVAFSRSTGTATAILHHWRTHSREGHRVPSSASGTISEARPRCVWSDVTLKGERWGRLHVMELNLQTDEAVTVLAIGRVAAAVAFSLLADRTGFLARADGESLVRDLVSGARIEGEDFLNRAAGLELDLGHELVALVVGVPPRQMRFARLVSEAFTFETVRSITAEIDWPSVWTIVNGRTIGIASATPLSGLSDTLSEVVFALAEKGLSKAHVGVSRPTQARALWRALDEAQAAWQLGPSTGDGPLHDYSQLALYRLLAPMLQGPELANFMESELGPLLALEDRYSLELINTLDMFLRCNGSKSATADVLHLQRRSVYYRLERIERLLGHPLEDADRRMRWYIALRAREMLALKSH